VSSPFLVLPLDSTAAGTAICKVDAKNQRIALIQRFGGLQKPQAMKMMNLPVREPSRRADSHTPVANTRRTVT
jgi:hypothetical protein